MAPQTLATAHEAVRYVSKPSIRHTCTPKPSTTASRGRHHSPQQLHAQPAPSHLCRSAASGAAAAADGGGSCEPPVDVTVKRVDKVGLPDEGMDPAVREALLKVQEALEEAEQTVQTLHTLPSARLPTIWDRLLSALRPVAQFAALAAGCAAMHALGSVSRLLGSLAVGVGVALYGWRRSSLSGSGAVAAALVGGATLAASYRSGLLLLTFFFASSKLTQFGEELKAVDEEHKQGGQRDWRQVCCNALVPAALALAAAHLSGSADLALGQAAPAGAGAAEGATKLLTALNAAFLGYYACCCGDTWASELGQLSPEEPRLITTLRPVRKGTNGGVTLLGLGASLAGGLAMGLTFLLCTLTSPARVGGGAAAAAQWWQLLLVGLGAGLAGSLIDSLLGATVQFTGYNRVTGKVTGRPGPDVSHISGSPLLDNNAVNAVSASLAAALTAALCAWLF